ncbi:MAG: MerR family transcriptional regulator [Caldithrix sp.]|nr:MerR family transcriptional regulator [Caldithrix sp.]
MNEEKRYPIKVVSRKTGLSLHVIRAWEKRYQVVHPQRTDSNRRLYSDGDVHKLHLLKQATDSGYSIGNIAHLSIDSLEELIGYGQKSVSQYNQVHNTNSPNTEPIYFLEEALRAVRQFDAGKLEYQLLQASVVLSQPILIEQVIVPLVEHIGNLWRQGDLRIMHEHMASAVLKSYLSNLRNAYRPQGNAPSLIVTTPRGQIHEIGALIIALVAAAEGWNVIYLGPDLPSEEIAAACLQKQARAVVLSLVYPADDPALYQDLVKLRQLLPERVAILIGGRIAPQYLSAINQIDAWTSDDLSSFRGLLEKLQLR